MFQGIDAIFAQTILAKIKTSRHFFLQMAPSTMAVITQQFI